MRQRASIPLLGYDERPNERQRTPGIASQLEGLEPTGLKEEPTWKPIFDVSVLDNFDHADRSKIVKCAWHTRGKIGKHGDDEGSLKRLVVLFNTGKVEVLESDWSTVVAYSVSSSQNGSWDMSFTQLYDTGYITVSKGGVPQQDLILEDDLLIEFAFPELPVVRAASIPGNEKYTTEQLESGEYKGFNDSVVFLRYAFILPGGVLVKHSNIDELSLMKRADKMVYQVGDEVDGWFTSYIAVQIEEYSQVPTNFAFWKDKIKGVAVLVSEPQKFDSEIDKREFLKNTAWFELSSFDFIDASDVDDKERLKVIDMKEDLITSLPVADVDDNTHHTKKHGPAITYNSRILLGKETVDFTDKVIHPREGTADMRIYCYDGVPWVESFDPNDEDFGWLTENDEYPTSFHVLGGKTNLGSNPSITGTNVDVVPIVGGGYVLNNSTAGWSVELDFGNYTVSFDNDDFQAAKNGSGFMNLDDGGPFLDTEYRRPVKVVTEIETEAGIFTRVSEERSVWLYDSIDGRRWYSGILSYPDIRAKSISIYLKDYGESDFKLISKLSLTSSGKENVSYVIRNYINVDEALSEYGDILGDIDEADEYTANKVVASVINSPLAFESDLVYSVGLSHTGVTGFAVNAVEVSQGQYGQYPLYVFKEDSVWALEQSQSADVVFGRISPIDIRLGVENERHMCNAGRVIVFKNDSGIFVLAGSKPEKISDPVKSILPFVRSLGYKRSNENEEILVAESSLTWHYSLTYGRWYASARRVNYFFSESEHLYCLDRENYVRDYDDPSSDDVAVSVRLNGVHFGYPDSLKRFYLFYLRGEFADAIAGSYADLINSSLGIVTETITVTYDGVSVEADVLETDNSNQVLDKVAAAVNASSEIGITAEREGADLITYTAKTAGADENGKQVLIDAQWEWISSGAISGGKDKEITGFKAIFGSKSFGSDIAQVRPKWRSEYDADVLITANAREDFRLHKIDAEFLIRYPRKQRSKS